MSEHHSHGLNHEDSEKELLLLIKYMIGHNESHTEELKELASEFKNHGHIGAYEKIMSAICDYESGNSKLKEALENINKG